MPRPRGIWPGDIWHAGRLSVSSPTCGFASLLLARLGLAAVWLAPGWVKAAGPAQSVIAVRAYDLLPEPLVQLVAIGLPALEIALGLLSLIGLATRWSAVLSVLLLLVLIGAVASSWARGL